MAFDTKFLDLIITSLEIISNYRVVGSGTLVGPEFVKIPLEKLKLMKKQYVQFTTQYEKSMAEILKKLNEDEDNKK